MTNLNPTCRTIALALATLCAATTLVAQSADNAWLDAPEATFLTSSERQEWWTLHTDSEREAFKDRYWARRDPTPETPRNEFRDVVMQRIDVADKRFTLNKKMRGALTWRGQVFIVFGSPARVTSQQSAHGEVDSPSGTARVLGAGRSTVEGNEITEHWYYERTRTPKILDALGRPSLDFTFVVEPVKQVDELQNPGLFHSLRDDVASKTVLNAIAAPPVTPAPAAPPASSPAKEITPVVATALDHAAEGTAKVRSSVLWNGDMTSATVWIVAPNVSKADGQLTLYGRVKDSSGKTVTSFVRAVDDAGRFPTSDKTLAVPGTISLPPGEYDAALVLNNQNDVTLASGATHFVVPESTSQLAVSSLVLTDGVNRTGMGLPVGTTHVLPRGDATFSTAESLWYVFQVANPSDPSKVTLAIRLRHGSAPPTSPTVVPAALEPIGAGRYMSGFEMPLRGLAPGEYTLYVTIHDPARQDDVLRRADFRVIEAPRLQ